MIHFYTFAARLAYCRNSWRSLNQEFMVSIVLVTYNRAARLRLSIQDILDQTFKDFELIICDDCSTDSTESVCRQFEQRDPRIRYFRHPQNMKMPGNCNFGIEQAKFDYVAILHDGDRFKPELIEQWYQAISSNESVAFVFNSIGETDARERIVKSYHEFDEGLVERDTLLKKEFFRRWRFNSPVYGEAMIRKSVLAERGLLHHDFGFYADVDLWMDLLHTHDAYYCADTLLTGPSKTLLPRLFEDNLIDAFVLKINMHLKHRKKAFRNKPMRLFYERIVLLGQSSLFFFYSLLLVIKNHSFGSFIRVPRMLGTRVVFQLIWVVIFVFYPVLYPVLKLFNIVKGSLPQVRLWFKRKKREPAHWVNWFLRYIFPFVIGQLLI